MAIRAPDGAKNIKEEEGTNMRPFTWVPLCHAVFSISYNLCNWYLFKNIKCNSVEFQTHQVTPNMKNIQKYKREKRNCTKFRLSDIRDLQIV